MILGVLEGLLFIVGDDGITIDKIKEILEISEEEAYKNIELLKEKYSSVDSGLTITKFGDYYRLATKKEHKNYYEKLVEMEDDTLLSQASLETLAIIAYNQPVTRIMVDEIRGINSSHIIRKLISKNLIHDVGRADTPGKPILYEVTKEFLDYFGLNSVEDLPEICDVEIDDTETDLYESKYKEN